MIYENVRFRYKNRPLLIHLDEPGMDERRSRFTIMVSLLAIRKNSLMSHALSMSNNYIGHP